MTQLTFDNKFLTDEQMYKQYEIASLLADRWCKYDRLEGVRILPALGYFRNVQVWLGTWSRTAPDWGEKYVMSNVAVRPAYDMPALATPSELARAWVDVTVQKQPRANSKQFDFWRSYKHFPPQLAMRGVYEDMTYVDLKSAYWSIMQVVGWGADYQENVITRNIPVSDFPYHRVKLSRNSLATVCLPSPSRIWYDGQIIERKGKRITNNGLYYLLVDILQAIAWDMIEFNPVYINTDGYIIPTKYVGSAIQKIDNEWGLLLAPKHAGSTRVFGIGSYVIGDKQTGHISTRAKSKSVLNDKIPRKMLKRFFRFLSERYPPVY